MVLECIFNILFLCAFEGVQYLQVREAVSDFSSLPTGIYRLCRVATVALLKSAEGTHMSS